tara:strand:+ start:215 stop:376 length:162 start_codon:yes stop_codon:yes gene_type:complete
MALRSEVRKTDNSKLGRAVLNNRANQSKFVKVEEVAEVAPTKPKQKKSTSTKK